MSKILIHTAAIGLLTLPLHAQDITYSAASLDYNSYTDDGSNLDLSSTTLSGAMEYENNQFLIGLEAGNQSFGGDAAFTENFLRWGVSAAYAINSEILVGAEYEAFKASYDSFDDELNSTNIFAQYETANFGVALNHRRLDSDFAVESYTTLFAQGSVGEMLTLGAVVEELPYGDEQAYHLSVDVAAGDWTGRGFYTNITGEELGYYGLRAGYDFGSGISATVGYDTSSDGFFSDFSSRSIGADYQVNDTVSLGARYTIYESDFGPDVQSLGVSLDYLMGSSKRLDSRMYQAASDDLSQSPLIEFPDYGFGLLFGFFGPS